MIRISDILKRDKQRKDKEKRLHAESSKKEIVLKLPDSMEPKHEFMPQSRPNETKEMKGTEEKAKISDIRISPIVNKGGRMASDEETVKLYEDTISLLREILREDVDYESLDIKRSVSCVEEIIDQLCLGNEKILMLALTRESIDENYLLCHLVNTCIFAIKIGLDLGYEKSKLLELGISVLLHDMGMLKYVHLAKMPRRLNEDEYTELKKHPIVSFEILQKIKGISKEMAQVAYQEHERIDASGYPEGLKREFIKEFAKILGVVDVYEAMIHSRSHRKALLSVGAIQDILANKKAFEYKLIKTLIESIGLFPIGSFVELNTKEVAQVIKPNRKIPLRPVVKILYGAGIYKGEKVRNVDLANHPTIWIKRGLRIDEVETMGSGKLGED